MIAALFVEKNGPYFGLPDVDPWDLERDARKYPGPHPVVAHPPCARWCRLAGLVEARWGHRRGEDGGCFESALKSVRRYGGVLEHPAYSDAWPTFDLPEPVLGGWQMGICGGWVCHVEQGRYGHPAKKATWLYAFGVRDLPILDFRAIPDGEPMALVSQCRNHVPTGETRPRVTKDNASRTPPPVPGSPARDREVGRMRAVESLSHRQRDRTPIPFRDLLISIVQPIPTPGLSEPEGAT